MTLAVGGGFQLESLLNRAWRQVAHLQPADNDELRDALRPFVEESEAVLPAAGRFVPPATDMAVLLVSALQALSVAAAPS